MYGGETRDFGKRQVEGEKDDTLLDTEERRQRLANRVDIDRQKVYWPDDYKKNGAFWVA